MLPGSEPMPTGSRLCLWVSVPTMERSRLTGGASRHACISTYDGNAQVHCAAQTCHIHFGECQALCLTGEPVCFGRDVVHSV